MSKAKKILLELVENKTFMTKNKNRIILIDIAQATSIIEKHLRDAHEEAVSATVMAMNKKTFVKPEYKD